MKRSLQWRILIRCMTVLLLAASVLSAGAAVCQARDLSDDSEKTVRIGIAEYPQSAYYDSAGGLHGIAVEYAYKIAQYANLKIEVTLIPDAESYFAALDSGKVDMLLDIYKSPAREETYLFSEYETGSSPVSVYVRKDEDRFPYGDINQLSGMTIGTEADSFDTTLFQTWCRENGVTPRILTYADYTKINAALERGEIDAGAYASENIVDYRTILQVAPTPYYVLFRKEEAALKRTVDKAMANLLADDPQYRQKLTAIYSAATVPYMDAYSTEEKAYIAAHPVITVAVLKSDAPYYSKGEHGVPHGILPDYYSEIAALTGQTIRFREYDTQAQAIAAIKTGDADVVAMFSNGLISAYRAGLRLTGTYASVNAVMVTFSGTGQNKIQKIAVKERSKGIIQIGLDAATAASLVTYNNATDCFDALNHHQVDAIICGLPSAAWLINQTNASRYSISAQSTIDMGLCGAVDYDNSVLCAILDKAIRVSKYQFNGIVARNTLAEDNWKTYLSRVPAAWIVGTAAGMILAIVVLVLALCSLLRQQKEKEAVAAEKAKNQQRELHLAVAEAANEEKNQFFSTISHDMRTPLNAIISFADFAQEDAVVPSVKESLAKIQSSARLLLNLINDTLLLSKIGKDKLRIHPKPISSAELVRSVAIPVQASAAQKGVALTVDDAVPPQMILADALMLQKILLNLLSNAVKYTPAGGHVAFSAAADAGRDDCVAIAFRVADDGSGISQEFLPRLFKPFEQENENGDTVNGTGLGLSIVKQLVDLMDGSIQVESEKGKGSVFTVRLSFPRACADAGCGETPDESHVRCALAGKRVLLCEDNALNAEIVCRLLENVNMTVAVARNGKRGLELFQESPAGTYDAVLMDIRMPEMNGFEATAAIRTLPRADAKTVPIVALTADVIDEDVEKMFAAGMNACLPKPVDAKQMVHTLAEQIQGKAGCKFGVHKID